MGEFGVSQSLARVEDLRLLRGGGRFTDDVAPSHALHGVVLRAPHAHAHIRSIDVSAAEAAPGVLGVFTGAGYRAAGLGDLPHIGPAVKMRDGTPLEIPPFAPLAIDRVRFVGEGVAFIVAYTAAQARDAAELIAVEYEQLPSVTGTASADADNAPLVWDDIARNEAFLHEIGDRAATEAAFGRAAHVVKRRFTISRVMAAAMEARGCVAAYDPSENRYTMWAPVQHPYVVRGLLANRILRVEEHQIRIVADDVGGSFGIKANLYPEYLLCLWAARETGVPVKWISERAEGFLGDFHGRDNVTDAELAMDGEGNFLALRVRTRVNIGAYFSPLGAGPAINNLGSLAGVYITPVAHVEVTGVMSHTQPTAPYRGAGRPEAAFVIERLIDAAARECAFDPVELRRRNLIPPDAMPFKTAVTFTYDSGEFERNIDDALALSAAAGFEERRREASTRGRLRGLGVAYAIERAGPPGIETAEIRFAPSGVVTLAAGTTSQGQGHATTYTQVLHEALGIAPDKVRVVWGDTDRIAFGFGAGGSRTSALGTAAILIAADKVIEKGRRIAAHILEAAEADIEFADGSFAVAGTDRALSLAEVAQAAFAPAKLPPDMEPGLHETGTYKGTTASYPNGCHVCEVEIDPETGRTEIVAYSVVDDFGTVINPLIVKGQVHGGVAQGAGQILSEACVYDPESGQLLTGSFMDYAMPRADDLCLFEVQSNPVPTTVNPLGVKGAGEAGTVGAMPAVMNAVIDALAPLGIHDIDMPATPERVWRAVRNAVG